MRGPRLSSSLGRAAKKPAPAVSLVDSKPDTRNPPPLLYDRTVFPPPPSNRPLTPIDRAWLRMDRPNNLMTINCVMTLSEPIDRETLLELVTARLLPVDRFRQHPVERSSRLGPRHDWVSAPIDLGFHVLSAELDGDGADDDLQRFIGTQMERPFAHGRPPWRIYRIGNYRGRSALFWQLQHCMGDGIALMVLLLSLTDLTADLDGLNPLTSLYTPEGLDPEEAYQHVESVMPEAARLMAKPAEAMAKTNPFLLWIGGLLSFARLALLPPDRSSAFKGSMGGTKRVSWSDFIPLETVQGLRQQFGGTVNDVLLTALSGALRRESQRLGRPPRDLRALVPVSLRPLDEMKDLGNRFGLVFLTLPLTIEDPAQRLQELRRRMRKLKWSFQPLVTMVALGVLGRLPQWVQALVLRIFGLKGSAVISSVPGPAKPLFLAGRAIEDMIFWVPQSAGLNLGLSILTYDGHARLGVMADAAVVPEPRTIVEAFHEELAMMSAGSP